MSPTQRVGQHAAAGAGAVGAAAEQIGAAGERQVEEALVLERLAEDHVEHGPVARVRQRVDRADATCR